MLNLIGQDVSKTPVTAAEVLTGSALAKAKVATHDFVFTGSAPLGFQALAAHLRTADASYLMIKTRPMQPITERAFYPPNNDVSIHQPEFPTIGPVT
jgi:hypothetical protein